MAGSIDNVRDAEDEYRRAEQLIGSATSELDAAAALEAWIVANAGSDYKRPLVGWDPRARAWWLFGGPSADWSIRRCWLRDTTGEVHRIVDQFLGIWGAEKPARKTERTRSSLLRLLQFRSEIVLDPDQWDVDPALLGTRPGRVVNLATGQVREAYPSDRISKYCSFTPAEEGAIPERWLAFLDEALGGDQALIDALQVFLGYALTGHVREHRFLAIVGAGGCGVSTFTNVFAHVAGDYATATASETFTATTGERHPADMAALVGVRAVIAAEVERGRRWSESRLKGFVAGDPQAARQMRGDWFNYTPVGKLIITGNGLPSIGVVDRAMRRRMLVVHFNRPPPKPNPRLFEELLAEEGPQILRWFIDGAIYWHCQGLDVPDTMKAGADAYFDTEDTFSAWVEDFASVDATATETVAALFKSWREFCHARNEPEGSGKAFAHLLQARGFKAERNVLEVASGRRVRGYRGLRLS